MAKTQESGILGVARVSTASEGATSLLGVRRELERDLMGVSWSAALIELKGTESDTGGSMRTANGGCWTRLTSRAVLGGLVRLRRGGEVLERTFFNELPTRGLENDFSTRWWVFVILPRAPRFCCESGCLSVKMKRPCCLAEEEEEEEVVDCFGCSLMDLDMSTDDWEVDLTRLELERPA